MAWYDPSRKQGPWSATYNFLILVMTVLLENFKMGKNLMFALLNYEE